MDPKQKATQAFNAMEARLAAALKPVKPSHKFVTTVKHRIKVASPQVVIQRVKNPASRLFILGGVLSGVVVIVTLARALYYLAGRSVSQA